MRRLTKRKCNPNFNTFERGLANRAQFLRKKMRCCRVKYKAFERELKVVEADLTAILASRGISRAEMLQKYRRGTARRLGGL